MKILVLGYARHGKDTVAEIIGDVFNLKVASSSQFANKHVVYPILQSEYKYETEMECWEDRINHREEWFNLICAYNINDKTRLTREILETNDIYVGMRSKEEFEASRSLFDIILWVDASTRHPPEDQASCTVSMMGCHAVIDNNGSLDELQQLVPDIIQLLMS